ncbi:MAG: SCO1664 family protein [Marmoricola sp.]
MPEPSVDLLAGELDIVGRIMPASNQTFLARLGGGSGTEVVYKPVRGERPLWDFTTGTLADREYAAWLVSEALGWDVVPPTVLREGPLGPGMVQAWQQVDPDQDPVDIVAAGAVPPAMLHVLDAVGGDDEPVSLVHEDTPPLRRMAVFDVVVNNTDRKGGHVLPMAGGHRFGVDHGVCFHVEDKLRTVLWGWAGQRLLPEERAGVEALVADTALHDVLGEHLTGAEVRAMLRRCRRLLDASRLPEADAGWPSIPWPAF